MSRAAAPSRQPSSSRGGWPANQKRAGVTGGTARSIQLGSTWIGLFMPQPGPTSDDHCHFFPIHRLNALQRVAWQEDIIEISQWRT
jgi:hypothetical protein